MFKLPTRNPNPAPDLGRRSDAQRWVRLLLEQKLRAAAKGRQVGRTSDADEDGMVDVRLAGPGDPKTPEDAFDRLRWGGLFAVVDENPQRVGKVMQDYDGRNGFTLEQGFDELWAPAVAGLKIPGVRIPGVTPRAYCFVARKTHLAMPGQLSDRFTYDVTLRADEGEAEGYCVRKRVPDVGELTDRLGLKYPDLDPADAKLRAESLVREVFPVFLTREVKVLEKLRKDLPPEFRGRVPRVLRIQRNDAGFVTRLDMSWLRNGGPVVSQLEFARQAAELLAVLHDAGGVMHLDLRPDNVVKTPEGVGFIDFGSAANVGEDLDASPTLGKLFRQMMRTSQIQRVLTRMIERGEVTDEAFAAVQGKVDRAVDTFFLAVQLNHPHANPELAKLVDHNPLGESARALQSLTAAFLRPKTPQRSAGKSAADLLRGIRRIERRFVG
ncbi:MAG: hypothetical protein AAF800_05830 [Planctomycetota bacterium]